MKIDHIEDLQCRYNHGVVCSDITRCNSCGFYRPVNRKRVIKIRSKLAGNVRSKEEKVQRAIRPIDANALLLKQYNASGLDDPQFAEMVVCVRDIIDAPTVDAASMVHAWSLMRGK